MTAWDDYISSLRDRLIKHPDTREDLAERAGGEVSASWLSKFARGEMTNPRADTLRALDMAMSDPVDLASVVDAARGVKPT